jgi:hypothetical protein
MMKEILIQYSASRIKGLGLESILARLRKGLEKRVLRDPLEVLKGTPPIS